MREISFNQNLNFILLAILGLLYIPILYLCVISFNTLGFRGIDNIRWIEMVSIILFLAAIILALRNIKFYASILIFVVLALPASVDNVLPSVLMSALTDESEVYFPLMTHVDIYLLIGILRYWSPNEKFRIQKRNKTRFGILMVSLGFMFVSILVNVFRHSNYIDTGLILSHSFHLRYFFLVILLFYNTSISKYSKYFLYGIALSVIFLLIEASYYTVFVIDRGRLISGTLKVNTFANIMCAISCYFTYLLIRKKIDFKYIVILILLVIGVFMTKTRSAIFIYVVYIAFEAIVYLTNRERGQKWKKLGVLLVLTMGLILLSLSDNTRYALSNFRIEKIDLSKTHLAEIIELKQNDFSEALILRLNHFQTSMNMIYDSPMLGIGSGRWNRDKTYFGSRSTRIIDSHNDLLAFSSQYGIIVGLFFLFCVYLLPYLNLKGSLGLEQDHSVKYLFIINIVMIFAGVSNAGLFKHQVFGLICIITVLSFYEVIKNESLNENRNSRNTRNTE